MAFGVQTDNPGLKVYWFYIGKNLLMIESNCDNLCQIGMKR